jgi:hypothetical protein
LPFAVNDDIVTRISRLKNLSFLDISYATAVTDEGLESFKEK